MIFKYQALTKENQKQTGNIEAANIDLAISALQRLGLIILDIVPTDVEAPWRQWLKLPERVKMKDLVIMSRQIATLFEAKVSALDTFRLMATESSNPLLRRVLTEVADDVNGGVQISEAAARHPEVFSDFYVSMVKAGEESGKLSEAFNYLAAHLERAHALISKAKNALIYPVFVIISFIGVMILMLTFVIPRLSEILVETSQEIPLYTKIVIGVSNFFVHYGILLLILLIVVGVFLFRYIRTQQGSEAWANLKLSVPYVGNLYEKLYLSRIADNLSTMLTSGIAMVRALDISAEVVGNDVYKKILSEASAAVKGGSQLSTTFDKHPEIPTIMIQMIKVGEETGKMGYILETLSRFYQREVNTAVETLVDLIEPALIIFLGLGVGVLLTSVLMPIYNLASGI